MFAKSEEIRGHYTGMSEVLTEGHMAKGMLIHELQEIQKAHNYLPAEELERLAERLNISLSEVYSTASFYKSFHFKPRGKNIVCVCMGTACHVRGASKVLDALSNEFCIKPGETTEDLTVTLETVGCVGCCGLAPVVTVNEEIVGEVDVRKTADVINIVKNRNMPGG